MSMGSIYCNVHSGFEVSPRRTQFVDGLFIGVCGIYLFTWIIRDATFGLVRWRLW